MYDRIARYRNPRAPATRGNTIAAEARRITRSVKQLLSWKSASLFCVFLAAALAAFGADKGARSAADKPRVIKLESAYLRLIDHVDVPAQVGGVLARIVVREGALVKENELLVQMDDVDASLALDRARFDLDVARTLASSQAKADEARTAVAEAEAAREKANFELEIARKKADSDIPLRFSKKAVALADAELQRALAARKEFRDSVSQNEIEHLQLASDKAKLDVEQAEQDLQTAGLTRQLKQSEVTTLSLTVQRREHDLKLALEGAQIAAITQRVREHDVAVAQRELDRRGIKSPQTGVVVQIFRHKGEWIEPGAKVVRVLRIDRLRAEGFIAARDVHRNLHGAGATVTVTLPDKSQVEVHGKIVFVSPEIDALNQQVLVWAEVENPGPQFVLRPGMKASMAVEFPEQ